MKTSSKQLFNILTSALSCNEDIIPIGFKTRNGWEKEWNCSSSHAKKLLGAGITKGLIEVKRFKIKRPHGVVSTPHYRYSKSQG